MDGQEDRGEKSAELLLFMEKKICIFKAYFRMQTVLHLLDRQLSLASLSLVPDCHGSEAKAHHTTNNAKKQRSGRLNLLFEVALRLQESSFFHAAYSCRGNIGQ